MNVPPSPDRIAASGRGRFRRHAANQRRVPALTKVVTGDYLRPMRVVGVKQLKAKLSEYLRDVRRGEVFLVTDRDEVVAELRPPQSSAPPPPDDVTHALELLGESGEVTPARLPKRGWAWTPQGIGLSAGIAAELLDALREERDGDQE